MGRVLAAVAVTVALAAALAGCAGRAPGVDGDLTNNWPPMPVPTLAVPADHACYDLPGMANLPTKLPLPVSCDDNHNLETVHVGAFTGADTATETPPPDGGPAQQKAYADCTGAARAFLGDDWRTGRVELVMTVPTDVQWGADARWYRCDLVQLGDLETYQIDSRQGSLRGALTGGRPVALTCFSARTSGNSVESMVAADCTARHNVEFAGVWTAPPGAYPDSDADRDKADLAGCKAVIATFARVPDDDRLQYRVGQLSDGFGEDEWAVGNRGVRCYIWMDTKPLTHSVRGVGPSGLPINYR